MNTYDYFYSQYSDQLADIIDEKYDELDQVSDVFKMCKEHSIQIQKAIQRMVPPFEKHTEGSIATIIDRKEYNIPPIKLLALQLELELETFIRKSFTKSKPDDENDLNAKIDAYLSGHKQKFLKEHPSIRFATARAVPDHSTIDLLIESKYIRGATTPSKATEGIAADLTKYPDEPLKLFIVYDPKGAILIEMNLKKILKIKGIV